MRHVMLQDQSIHAANHDDRVERHEQRRHWTAEPASTVQNDQRNREQGEPNMRAHPALQCAEPPEHHFFAHAEQRRENENRKRDRAKNETERRAANAAMLGRLLNKIGWEVNSRRHALRMKVCDVKNNRRHGREENEDEPRNVCAVKNAHLFKIPKPRFQIRIDSACASSIDPGQLGFGTWDLGFPSVCVVRFVVLRRRPRALYQFILRQQCIAEKASRLDALGRVVRTGIDATRRGQLRAEIASVRLVSGRFFLLDLDLGWSAFLLGFDLGLYLLDHFQRMHVDVAVRAKLGAFAATDAPVLDDDLEIFLASNRANRALRHTKRVTTGSTSSGDKKVIVAQTVAQQAGHAVVGLCASAHASVAVRAIVEIDEQEILRLEQSQAKKIIEPKTGGKCSLLDRSQPRFGHRLELRADVGKSLEHEIELARGNFHNLDGVERGAGRGALDRAEQSDFAEIIAAAQVSGQNFADRHGLREVQHSRSDAVHSIRFIALYADHVVLVVRNQLDLFLEIIQELFA